MLRARLALIALTTGAVTMAPLAAPASAWPPGDTPVPDVQSISAFCGNAPDAAFTDVRSGDAFADAISCVMALGITRGGPENLPTTQYGPELTIQRGAMASFVARAMDAADLLDVDDRLQSLPGAVPSSPESGTEFRDVPLTYVHADSIRRLASAGVVLGGVAGGATDLYSPDNPVTRAQMATYLNRAIAFLFRQDPGEAGRTTGIVGGDADYYIDDEALEPEHQLNITALTSAGISNGSGGQRYNPTMSINRGQMAAFLARTVAELLDRGLIDELRTQLGSDLQAASP